MASIISVNARYSGTVAFSDRTKEYFHCQMEDDRLWSIDASGSLAAEGKIKWAESGGAYPHRVHQNTLWQTGLPFLSSASLNTSEVTSKTVNGIALHGEVLFALDDGTTWPSSMTYDSHYGYQWTNGGAITPDNLQTYVDMIETMLLQIMDTATLTIA